MQVQQQQGRQMLSATRLAGQCCKPPRYQTRPTLITSPPLSFFGQPHIRFIACQAGPCRSSPGPVQQQIDEGYGALKSLPADSRRPFYLHKPINRDAPGVCLLLHHYHRIHFRWRGRFCCDVGAVPAIARDCETTPSAGPLLLHTRGTRATAFGAVKQSEL